MMKRRRELRANKAGFTLVEMLLVIGLIALLAGVVVFNAGNIFGTQQEQLMEFKVKESFKTPLFKYKMDTGNFPTTEAGLNALLNKPSNDRGRWRGPYIDGPDDLEDAWGNTFQYRFPGTKNPGGYDLYSLGPDGVESEDDIGNWE